MPIARPDSTGGSRVIAHVDIDCFYVQVEQRKQPHLRGQPTAVVQYNSWKGGGLIAVGYEARKDGVKRSMRGDEAKQVCPEIQLVQVPVARGKADLTIYRNAGSEVVSILSKKGRCERASIDEVYLDLTDVAEAMLAETPPASLEIINEEALKSYVLGLNEDGGELREKVREWFHNSDADHCDQLLACGAIIVADLRMQVLKETQFTCSAGIAHNKMLAKLASGMNKPAQQTVVPSASVQGLLEALPIKKMKQLGGKLGTSLQVDLGVTTVGELLQFPEEKLQDRYGVNTGTWLWNTARGINGEEVKGRLLPESHGSGKTFPGFQALKTVDSVERWLNELCEELSERLQIDLDQNKRMARTLTLHATAFNPNDNDSHKKFPSKSCSLRYGAAKIKEDALNLFHAALREYVGAQKSQTQGSHRIAWLVTGLSVSASKIVAIPSGTSSIMKYFRGQDHSCSLKLATERFIPEAAPSSPTGMVLIVAFGFCSWFSMFKSKQGATLPSGSESYSGQHSTEPPMDFQGEEVRIGQDIPRVDWQQNNREKCTLKDISKSLSTHDQETPWSLTKQAPGDTCKQETTEAPISGTDSFLESNKNKLCREFYSEGVGNSFLTQSSRLRDQKRKLANDKGSSSILRFFQNHSSPSSRDKQEHANTIVETRSSSSNHFSGFPPVSNCSESNASDLAKESLLSQAGRESNVVTSGQEEWIWNYKLDEIDLTVLNELPPEIRNEVQAWLHPQKRVNVPKRGNSISNYFLPTKNA